MGLGGHIEAYRVLIPVRKFRSIAQAHGSNRAQFR